MGTNQLQLGTLLEFTLPDDDDIAHPTELVPHSLCREKACSCQSKLQFMPVMTLDQVYHPAMSPGVPSMAGADIC
jgi:hypothetical protein